LLSNKPWLVLFAVGVLFVSTTVFRGGVTMYYFKYYIDNTGIAAVFMVVGLLASMAGAAVTGPLTRRYGNRVVMNTCIVLGVVSSAALFVIGPGGLTGIFILSAITEFSTGPIIALFFAMLADAADYSEWRTGRQAMGLFFSAGTLSIKVGGAIGAAITGWMLAWFGYVANAEQTVEALLGIRLLFSLVPALVGVLLLIAFQFYTLSSERMKEIEMELAQRTGKA
jgi:GPH family glycoside/pentoside/hexuronide:cation symporter